MNRGLGKDDTRILLQGSGTHFTAAIYSSTLQHCCTIYFAHKSDSTIGPPTCQQIASRFSKSPVTIAFTYGIMPMAWIESETMSRTTSLHR